MRYIATPAHHSYREGLYDVRREGFLIATCEEAEAHIIAFALNSVADGYGLCRNPDQDEFVGFDHKGAVYEPVQYDGPTEGVAP